MHVEAKAAFQEIETADPQERGDVWASLQPQLELHERIEERLVYDPVAREAGPHDAVLGRWEHEHEEQVKEADATMDRLDHVDPAEDAWLSQLTALHATLDGHIRHEEEDIWPRIRKAWGTDKLEQAGRAIRGAKAAAKDGASVDEAVRAGAAAMSGNQVKST
jgi:iron-sulfur cluster repair protein YtfE (RIC family)